MAKQAPKSSRARVPAKAPTSTPRLARREVLAALRRLRRGELDARLPDGHAGIDGQIGEAFNDLAALVQSLTDELDAVREATRDGETRRRVATEGLRGGWRRAAAAINASLDVLAGHSQDVARVVGAIAAGDLSQRIDEAALDGERLRQARALNGTVDTLATLGAELTRVARAVGREGRPGAQVRVKGARGLWQDVAAAVDAMSAEVAAQVHALARATDAVARGEPPPASDVEARGELLALRRTVDAIAAQLAAVTGEVTRVARDVSVEGRLGGRAEPHGAAGAWRRLIDDVNQLAGSLTTQVRDLAQVTTAVARGDLSRKVTIEVRGEILDVKNTINTMVDQLGLFAAEVVRIGRDVGEGGVLGGRIEVRGVSGVWKDMVDHVNFLAGSVTDQVRGIARVVTAVARGDLTQKLHLPARGEVATFVDTINDMIATLSLFAAQVSGVARAVGVEGRLGGQADVPGAAGVWRDLTNNVNELAGNLTRQVRAIGAVADAVTRGDLTRAIDVEASGEVAALKDDLNTMIRALAETTRVNQEQDWLKTNLTRFTRMLQGQRDLKGVARDVLSEIAPTLGAQYGAFYMAQGYEGDATLRRFAGYAASEEAPRAFAVGEGLVGQAAALRRPIVVADVPPDYVQIESGLGQARPLSLVVVPVMFEGEVKGVVELAGFQPFGAVHLAFLEQFQGSLGIVIASIEAQMRTDELLRRSQELAEELQTQQDELRQTNEELERRARQLSAQNSEVERKNQEVELARQELEEKAEQLALTSKYKSQFLANMSHELRTPLNSLLILSRQLADNRQGNLDARQIEYARTIHQAGADLLELINEILDLAKIESGTMHVELGEVELGELRDHVERTFRHVAEEKQLAFTVTIDPALPPALVTDEMRLKQVLRNLLSNAFKFTARGEVALAVRPVREVPGLTRGDAADGAFVAFAVTDSGIGIAPDQQKLIFEAFQQADGTETRKYGGTGLGLAISREIAGLLGGDVRVESRPGSGSTFTLYLPQVGRARARSAAAPASPPSQPPRALRPAAEPATREAAPAGERMLLVIAGDDALARTLVELARTRGFCGVVAESGEQAIDLVQKVGPEAIVLDVELPDMDGWVLLDRLKHDPRTRHIPVHAIAADGRRALAWGALGTSVKPVGGDALLAALAELQARLERPRRLLVVDADAAFRADVAAIVGGDDIEATAVADVAAATLAAGGPDCVIVGGPDALAAVAARPELQRAPVIVYAPAEPSPEAAARVEQLAAGLRVEVARTADRLLDASALHLHRAHASLSPAQRDALQRAGMNPPALVGRKILVVDDDVRNIFTLTAVLEHYGVKVVFAEDGRQALDRLAEHRDVDLVLMDIMMPEMDGYEATRRIRAAGDATPILALTAKAMKGDREKCLRAGASDYITKPVDPDQLASLLRVWLAR